MVENSLRPVLTEKGILFVVKKLIQGQALCREISRQPIL